MYNSEEEKREVYMILSFAAVMTIVFIVSVAAIFKFIFNII